MLVLLKTKHFKFIGVEISYNKSTIGDNEIQRRMDYARIVPYSPDPAITYY